MNKWNWCLWKCVRICLVCFLSDYGQPVDIIANHSWQKMKQTQYLWCRKCNGFSEMSKPLWFHAYEAFRSWSLSEGHLLLYHGQKEFCYALWDPWCFLFVYRVVVIQHSLELCLSICWLDWQLMCRELIGKVNIGYQTG